MSTNSEVGQSFLGFTSRDLRIIARRQAGVDTSITITDLVTNTDADSDDTQTLTATDAVLVTAEIEVYELTEFEDDTVRIEGNVPMSVLAGYAVAHTDSDSNGAMLARNDGTLTVNIVTNGDPMDDDYVAISADKPVLVYIGPVASNTTEMCDVAFSVPTGPDSRIVYAFAQNSGNSNDLQIFGFDDDTEVTITSLTQTDNFRNNGQHDFLIGPGIAAGSPADANADGPWLRGSVGADVWWGSGVWNAELLRIESNRPITVINGDYDGPHFGAFVPFVLANPTLPPTAVATASADATCPGEGVTLDGTGSFDSDSVDGGQPVQYLWDLDIAVDSDGVGCACPRTQGYWKNHVEAWAVDSLVLGDHGYTQEELLTLLRTPVRGDASVNLAHQLIAAKLNVAGGAVLTGAAEDAIAQADDLLTGLIVPAGIDSGSADGQAMLAVKDVLDDYNNGDLGGLECTDDDDDGGGSDGGERGNNGVGNGEDPQPRGDPPVNEGPGTGPGEPGNRGG
ncbi:hypothetical protein [Haliangium sp.]|uniref:hypothetical protein n=1 Tax=Haliangium sp. TaxID=2663208 RepID=UPI003D126A3F